MKRLFLTFLTLFVFFAVTFAAPISEETAREKATRFMLSKKQEGTSSARGAQRFGGSSLGATLTSIESQEAYYVFNIDSVNGYVIVSGDDRMPDVLGYAYHGTYNPKEIPDNMRAWLQGYVEEYQYLQSHSDAKGAAITTVVGDKIFPLLDCRWNQYAPYNDQCPMINGKRTVTGCVATAMAQIMYYHKWPQQTTKKIPAYTTPTKGIQMPAIGITNIDWDNMMPTYSSYSSEAQKKAVSTLMRLCGSAVMMDYDLDGSGASCWADIFVDYFGYNKIGITSVSHDNYSNKVWNQMMYDELKNGRPVFYSGDGSDYSNGHAFVVDGYDGGDYFHINWGWGGYEDNYFLLTALNTHVGNFSFHQGAIIGIDGGMNPTRLPYAVLNDGVLTFYYDNKYGSRSGRLLNWYSDDWYFKEFKQEVTSVVFDPTCADYKYLFSTNQMFANCSNLVSIQGLEYLSTENVTDMSWMFWGCSNLTSLNVSNFNTQKVTSMSGMFYGCNNLISLDLSNFNTQNVKNMSNMFSNCSSLTSLDVSSFNTSNVTDMSSMFSNCSSLTSLDVSSFNTSNVTDMSSMFSDCSSLTSLDVSSFNTLNVTDMGYMFSGFSNLTSLDLSNFHTWNVTDMRYMFSYSSSLTSIDVSNFDTPNVTNISGMFFGCSSLISLDLSSFDTQKVTNMRWIFNNCSALEVIYSGENWNTSNVIYGNYMFNGCYELIGEKGTQYEYSKNDSIYAHIDGGKDNPGYFSTKGALILIPYAKLSDDSKVLTFYCGDRETAREGIKVKSYANYSSRGWDSVCSSIETVVFDKSFANYHYLNSTKYWFCNCENLTSVIGLENLNTEDVIDMGSMFSGCSSLTSLDLSHFDTQNVTDMGSMFYNCSGLASLDVSNFNTQNATNMRYMFYGCKNLTSLDVSNFNTQNVTSMSYMFYRCNNLTSLDVSHFNTQNVTNMCCLFYECQNLTSLDLRNFNTQNMTNMSYMFCGCYSLQDIYIGENWSTQNVTNGNDMFSGCSNLIGEKGTQYDYKRSDYTYAHLDGGIDNPGYFSTMGYSYCYALLSDDNKTLTFYYGNGKEVTGSIRVMSYDYYSYRDWDSVAQSLETVVFDKSMADCDNISGTAYWFYNCENLTTIQGLEYLNTRNATNMRYMFYGCKNLTSLDVSNFNTQNVTSMSYMFYRCNNLTSIDVSHFNTQNVTSMSYMFYQCENLTSLDLRSFNTQNVTSMSYMFCACYSLQDIYIGENWSTQNVTNGNYMFSACYELIGEKGTQYDYKKSDYTYAHIDGGIDNPGYFSTMGYSYCYALLSDDNKTLTFYYGNGKEVTGGMRVKSFGNSSNRGWDSVAQSLETVVFDKSMADCDNISGTAYWFYNCENITTIQGLEYLNTQNVTDMSYMFYGCKKLTSLDLSNFNTQNVTSMNGMFSGCENLTSLDLSNFNTQNVTNMSSMFYGCENLTSLDVSHFNTQNVTSMGSMFTYCYNLTSLDLSNFDTQNVTSMSYMFYYCRNLNQIYASEVWNTEKLEYGDYMFSGCRNLVGQDGTTYNYNYTDKTKAHYGAGGYLTYKSRSLRGDVNDDGIVNGTDIQAIINIIVAGSNDEKADINNDNVVNGTDIQEVINIIVKGN